MATTSGASETASPAAAPDGAGRSQYKHGFLHYFWTGLELRVLMPDPARGRGFWFVMINRGRSGSMTGLAGSFIRSRVGKELQDEMRVVLSATKAMIEDLPLELVAAALVVGGATLLSVAADSFMRSVSASCASPARAWRGASTTTGRHGDYARK